MEKISREFKDKISISGPELFYKIIVYYKGPDVNLVDSPAVSAAVQMFHNKIFQFYDENNINIIYSDMMGEDIMIIVLGNCDVVKLLLGNDDVLFINEFYLDI